jgi:hypothetical protein
VAGAEQDEHSRFDRTAGMLGMRVLCVGCVVVLWVAKSADCVEIGTEGVLVAVERRLRTRDAAVKAKQGFFLFLAGCSGGAQGRCWQNFEVLSKSCAVVALDVLSKKGVFYWVLQRDALRSRAGV